MHARSIAAILGSSSVIGVAAFVVCCGFPDYVAVDAVDDTGSDDGATDETGSDAGDDADFDTGPIVTCGDSGVRAGGAIACSCAGGDAGVDETEAGPGGFTACKEDGTFATTCDGCPASCEGTTLPSFATCIPGGVVSIGVATANAIEAPAHQVAFTRFFLDDHEVTVGRFRTWWNAGHVAPNDGDEVFTAGDGTKIAWKSSWTIDEPTKNDGTAPAQDANWLGADQAANDARPINGVDWATALAFCMANKARLPTEAEWEAAASGRSDRLFPWSPAGSKTNAPTPDMIPCTDAISAASGSSCGPPVKSAIDGFSVDGAFDMAGSVAEWTLDVAPFRGGASCVSGCYSSAPQVDPVTWLDASTLRAIRGGSYVDSDPKSLRAQARAFADATKKALSIGFRCASR